MDLQKEPDMELSLLYVCAKSHFTSRSRRACSCIRASFISSWIGADDPAETSAPKQVASVDLAADLVSVSAAKVAETKDINVGAEERTDPPGVIQFHILCQKLSRQNLGRLNKMAKTLLAQQVRINSHPHIFVQFQCQLECLFHIQIQMLQHL